MWSRTMDRASYGASYGDKIVLRLTQECTYMSTNAPSAMSAVHGYRIVNSSCILHKDFFEAATGCK